MSFTTGTVAETMLTNTADYTAVASTNAEATLLTGPNEQPTFLPPFFYNKPARGRAFLVEAQGVLSNTGTPTLIFQARMSSTQGVSTLSGSSLGVTAAILTTSGVTNKWWRLWLKLICTTPGQGTNNCTLAGAGFVESPGGFASPFIYPLEPTTPDTATWTSTIDGALAQYLNLSVTWSANSSSNTITLKQLAVMGLN